MILGIDLGTSSIKIVGLESGRVVRKYRQSYRENTPDGWIQCLCSGLSHFQDTDVEAIGIASQVGTYVVNGSYVLSWQDGAGREELARIRDAFSDDDFLREISMIHPQIFSYPMPRILWLQKHFAGEMKEICQPKEILIRFLTGTFVSDPYSWRGLANQKDGKYSKKMLQWLGIEENLLPELIRSNLAAGTLKADAAARCGLPSGIPVYTGSNDFYASLIGMGITDIGSCFDVTGTSEHMGVITSELLQVPTLAASPYIRGNVCYGVTASSGSSLDFGLRELDLAQVRYESYRSRRDLPLFLPYLNGERAPIYDADARGVFFGLQTQTTKEMMAYSVMEGVVFSIYHIYSEMHLQSAIERMVIAGGAAKNEELNQMKADLFELPVSVCAETDTSALGAAIWAAVGERRYSSLREAAGNICAYERIYLPRSNEVLQERFAVYRQLYGELKTSFARYSEMIRKSIG